MAANKDLPVELSGILDKRRQNLKFQWRTYSFVLRGMELSYYKIGGSNNKEGELWGTIDLQEVASLSPADPAGARYPFAVTLKTGKAILLASDSHFERERWLRALQEKMVVWEKRRSLAVTNVRETPTQLRQLQSTSEAEITGSPADLDEFPDLDDFIDQTFNGITFNRQSQMVRNEEIRHQGWGGNKT